jgi:hypothetical protein
MNIRDIKTTNLMALTSSASATLGVATSILPSASLAKKECYLQVHTAITSGTPVWTIALSESSSSTGSMTKVDGVTDFTTISTTTTTTFKVSPTKEYLRAEVGGVATAGSGTLIINLLHFNREST